MPIKALKTSKSAIFSRNQAMKNQFLQPKCVENVSNMSQPIRNIIINDQKHILDLIKSHKSHLKKRCSPLPKKIPKVYFQLFKKCYFWGCDVENWVWIKLALWICPILWIRVKIGYTQLSLTFFHYYRPIRPIYQKIKIVIFWKKSPFFESKCALEGRNLVQYG